MAASLYSPKTGIMLEMFTNEPGVQVYTGNFQGTGVECKHGVKYPKHVSVCLESQILQPRGVQVLGEKVRK